MTQNEFKQGDKVATKKCYDISIYGCSTTIPIGEEGEIEDIYGDELYVYFSGYSVYLTIPVSDVELIQPLDRKTAFLTELRELMRRYNAFFSVDAEGARCEDDVKKVELTIFIGEERMTRDVTEDCVIEADNIMDFDKE